MNLRSILPSTTFATSLAGDEKDNSTENLSLSFINAVKDNNNQKIEYCLSHAIDLNYRDSEGNTAYDYASLNGNTDLCDRMIKMIHDDVALTTYSLIMATAKNVQQTSINHCIEPIYTGISLPQQFSAVVSQYESFIKRISLDEIFTQKQILLRNSLTVTLDFCLTITNIIKIYAQSTDKNEFETQFKDFLSAREDLLCGDTLDYCYNNTLANQLCYSIAKTIFPNAMSPANVLYHNALNNDRNETQAWRDYRDSEEVKALPNTAFEYFRCKNNSIHLYDDVIDSAITRLINYREDKLDHIWLATDQKNRDEPLNQDEIYVLRQRTPTLAKLVQYTEILANRYNDNDAHSVINNLKRIRELMRTGDKDHKGQELESSDAGYWAVAQLAEWWNSLNPNTATHYSDSNENPGFRAESKIQQEICAVAHGRLGRTLAKILDPSVGNPGHTRITLLPHNRIPTRLQTDTVYLTQTHHSHQMKARWLVKHEDTFIKNTRKISTRPLTAHRTLFPLPFENPKTIKYVDNNELVLAIVSDCGSTVPRNSSDLCLFLAGRDLEEIYTCDTAICELNTIDNVIDRRVPNARLLQWRDDISKELKNISLSIKTNQNRFKKFISIPALIQLCTDGDIFEYKHLIELEHQLNQFSEIDTTLNHTQASKDQVVKRIFLLEQIDLLQVLFIIATQNQQSLFASAIATKLYVIAHRNDNTKIVSTVNSYFSTERAKNPTILDDLLLLVINSNDVELIQSQIALGAPITLYTGFELHSPKVLLACLTTSNAIINTEILIAAATNEQWNCVLTYLDHREIQDETLATLFTLATQQTNVDQTKSLCTKYKNRLKYLEDCTYLSTLFSHLIELSASQINYLPIMQFLHQYFTIDLQISHVHLAFQTPSSTAVAFLSAVNIDIVKQYLLMETNPAKRKKYLMIAFYADSPTLIAEFLNSDEKLENQNILAGHVSYGWPCVKEYLKHRKIKPDTYYDLLDFATENATAFSELLEMKPDVDLNRPHQWSGDNLIHRAVLNKSALVVEILCKKNVNIRIEYTPGVSAIDLALQTYDTPGMIVYMLFYSANQFSTGQLRKSIDFLTDPVILQPNVIGQQNHNVAICYMLKNHALFFANLPEIRKIIYDKCISLSDEDDVFIQYLNQRCETLNLIYDLQQNINQMSQKNRLNNVNYRFWEGTNHPSTTDKINAATKLIKLLTDEDVFFTRNEFNALKYSPLAKTLSRYIKIGIISLKTIEDRIITDFSSSCHGSNSMSGAELHAENGSIELEEKHITLAS